METEKIREILTAPLSPDDVEWRVQSQTSDKAKLIVVPYINNRCVMERLDKAFGWENWSNEFQPINEGFICTITARIGDKVVSKSDGASNTNIEPIKGGISDSMKRVAVQFGMGRELYNYPKVMIATNEKFIPTWAKERLYNFVKAFNEGKLDRELYVIEEKK
jgi:hypothetical protein